MRKSLLAVAAMMAVCQALCEPAQAGEYGAPAVAAQGGAAWRPTERWRGFNLLEMFIWHKEAKLPVYREADFRQIKEWGFNFVRLPIDYRYWTHGGDWNRIDEEWVKPVDRAIELGGKYGLHVQVCLHRAPGYCINRGDLEPEKLFEGSENARSAFVKHWTFLAKRYADIPKERHTR